MHERERKPAQHELYGREIAINGNNYRLPTQIACVFFPLARSFNNLFPF